MTEYAVDIVVTLKPVVNDPQGLSVAAGLRALGYTEVSSARVGKLVELVVTAADEGAARDRARGMCEKLLCNPVIEEWRIDALRELAPPATAGAG